MNSSIETKDFTFVYSPEQGSLSILFVDPEATNFEIVLLPSAVTGMLQLLSENREDVSRHVLTTQESEAV
jgi:hypothetical protein